MLQPIPSTAEILACKVLNHDFHETWVAWAVDMLIAGFDTENLIVMAGITAPYNQFEMQPLTAKAFDELNLDYSDPAKVIENYAFFLVSECLNNQQEYFQVLRYLNNLYLELDYDKKYQDFSLLYYAKDDLRTDEHQWYWQGADRSNIDSIIKTYFDT